MKKPVLIGILLFAAVVAVLLYSTVTMPSNRVEVCMQFNGRTSCRTNSGSTKEFALRSARSTACSDIASGVTETMSCESSEPASVTWK
ncbi:MAG: hypothetical protein ACRD30_00815 [Bryobacteraceae bacterium]